LYNIGVLEPVSGRVTGLIRDWLAAANNPAVVLTRGDCFASFTGGYDLFVVASTDFGAEAAHDLSCRALLVPGSGDMKTLSAIPSQWVVSYGLAGRDSITVSSLGRDFAQLALLRELVTLSDVVVERQEIPVLIPPESSAPSVMAMYGSLLILGVPPEMLAQSAPVQIRSKV